MASGLWAQAEGLRVRFQPEMVWGSPDSTRPDHFGRLVGVVTDAAGSLYILHAGAEALQRFDAQGHYLQTLARRGRGPGTLLRPAGLTLDQQGQLYVADRARSQIVVLDSVGHYVKSLPLSFPPQALRAVGDRLVIQGLRAGHLFHLYSLDGRYLASFGERYDLLSLSARERLLKLGWGAPTLGGTPQGTLVVSRGYPYELQEYDLTGRLLQQITRASSLFEDPGPGDEMGEILRNSRTITRTAGVLVLPDGKILNLLAQVDVREIQQLTETLYLDLFDPQGRFLASQALEPGFPRPIWVDRGGKVYGIQQEPSPRVIRYGVTFE